MNQKREIFEEAGNNPENYTAAVGEAMEKFAALEVVAKNREGMQLLMTASNEIQGLRKANYEKGIRLQMFDDMMLLLRTQTPGRGMAECPDIVGDIRNYVEKIAK